MATLSQLQARNKLESVSAKDILRPNKQPERAIYLSERACNWLRNDLTKIRQPHHTEGEPTARDQAIDLFHEFISGGEFNDIIDPHIMKPKNEAIWTLRTTDLRFYGWFCNIGVIILNSAATKYELELDKKLYDDHVNDCIEFRDALDLDEPKTECGDLNHVLQL